MTAAVQSARDKTLKALRDEVDTLKRTIRPRGRWGVLAGVAFYAQQYPEIYNLVPEGWSQLLWHGLNFLTITGFVKLGTNSNS